MKYIFISIGLLFLYITGNGQNATTPTPDSLQRELQHTSSPTQQADLMALISMGLADIKPDSALQIGRQGAALATKWKDEEDYAACLNSIGWVWHRLGKNDSAEYYLVRAKDLFHKIHKDVKEAKTLINMGSVYQNTENNEKSLDCLLAALKLEEGSHDTVGKAYAEKMIGVIYREQGQSELAKVYLHAAVETFRQLHDDGFLATSLVSLGLLYYSIHSYDSALICYREAQRLHRQSGQIIGEAYSNENTADVFLAEANGRSGSAYVDSALDHYRQSYDFFKKAGSQSDQAYEELNIGKTLTLLKRYDQARQRLDEALQVFIKDRSFSYAYEASAELSKVYKKKGDYKRSVDYLERSIVYKDSLDAANRKETMANMLARYEADKKDKTIQLLNTQKALADKELSRDRVIEIFSFCLVVLMVALAIILWRQVRIKQQLKEVRIRNQIAGDLHDDIGSSLSSILLLSNMAGRTTEQHGNGNTDLYDPKNVLHKIGITAREVMEKVSDIVWTMNSQNDDGISIKERLEKLAIQVKEVSSLPIHLDISSRLENMKVPMDLRKNIYLICKEALNNILKHANASSISFIMDIRQKNIHLEIKDDGRGFDIDNHCRGNGIGIMTQRARVCGGTCGISTSPGQGTSVTIVLPIPHSRYIFS